MLSSSSFQRKSFGEKKDSQNVGRQLVDLEILYLLSSGPKNGYGIKKHLLSLFRTNVSYGTLYPHLHSLEKAQLISGMWDTHSQNSSLKRRMYKLTHTGLDKLGRSIENLSKIAFTMQFMLAHINLNTIHQSSPQDSDSSIIDASEFLLREGYSTQRDLTVKGASGVDHQVDLIASRASPDGSKTEKVVLRTIVSETGVSLDDLLKIHVLASDIGAGKVIVLSSPAVQEEVRKFAEFCHISVYSGKDLREAVFNMRSQFKHKA